MGKTCILDKDTKQEVKLMSEDGVNQAFIAHQLSIPRAAVSHCIQILNQDSISTSSVSSGLHKTDPNIVTRRKSSGLENTMTTTMRKRKLSFLSSCPSDSMKSESTGEDQNKRVKTESTVKAKSEEAKLVNSGRVNRTRRKDIFEKSLLKKYNIQKYVTVNLGKRLTLRNSSFKTCVKQIENNTDNMKSECSLQCSRESDSQTMKYDCNSLVSKQTRVKSNSNKRKTEYNSQNSGDKHLKSMNNLHINIGNVSNICLRSCEVKLESCVNLIEKSLKSSTSTALHNQNFYEKTLCSNSKFCNKVDKKEVMEVNTKNINKDKIKVDCKSSVRKSGSKKKNHTVRNKKRRTANSSVTKNVHKVNVTKMHKNMFSDISANDAATLNMKEEIKKTVNKFENGSFQIEPTASNTKKISSNETDSRGIDDSHNSVSVSLNFETTKQTEIDEKSNLKADPKAVCVKNEVRETLSQINEVPKEKSEYRMSGSNAFKDLGHANSQSHIHRKNIGDTEKVEVGCVNSVKSCTETGVNRVELVNKFTENETKAVDRDNIDKDMVVEKGNLHENSSIGNKRIHVSDESVTATVSVVEESSHKTQNKVVDNYDVCENESEPQTITNNQVFMDPEVHTECIAVDDTGKLQTSGSDCKKIVDRDEICVKTADKDEGGLETSDKDKIAKNISDKDKIAKNISDKDKIDKNISDKDKIDKNTSDKVKVGLEASESHKIMGISDKEVIMEASDKDEVENTSDKGEVGLEASGSDKIMGISEDEVMEASDKDKIVKNTSDKGNVGLKTSDQDEVGIKILDKDVMEMSIEGKLCRESSEKDEVCKEISEDVEVGKDTLDTDEVNKEHSERNEVSKKHQSQEEEMFSTKNVDNETGKAPEIKDLDKSGNDIESSNLSDNDKDSLGFSTDKDGSVDFEMDNLRRDESLTPLQTQFRTSGDKLLASDESEGNKESVTNNSNEKTADGKFFTKVYADTISEIIGFADNNETTVKDVTYKNLPEKSQELQNNNTTCTNNKECEVSTTAINRRSLRTRKNKKYDLKHLNNCYVNLRQLRASQRCGRRSKVRSEVIEDCINDNPKFAVVDIENLKQSYENLVCAKCYSHVDVKFPNTMDLPSEEFQLKCFTCQHSKRYKRAKSCIHEVDYNAISYDSLYLRLVFSSLDYGGGYNQLLSTCLALNIPNLSFMSYKKYCNIAISQSQSKLDVILKSAGDAVHRAYKEAGADPDANGVRDITVTYDGSWISRGPYPKYGLVVAIDLVTGLVLDYHLMSRFCSVCSAVKRKKPNKFEAWKVRHKKLGKCQINYESSPEDMEIDAALILCQRSVQKHKLRYNNLSSPDDVNRSLENVGDCDKSLENSEMALPSLLKENDDITSVESRELETRNLIGISKTGNSEMEKENINECEEKEFDDNVELDISENPSLPFVEPDVEESLQADCIELLEDENEKENSIQTVLGDLDRQNSNNCAENEEFINNIEINHNLGDQEMMDEDTIPQNVTLGFPYMNDEEDLNIYEKTKELDEKSPNHVMEEINISLALDLGNINSVDNYVNEALDIVGDYMEHEDVDISKKIHDEAIGNTERDITCNYSKTDVIIQNEYLNSSNNKSSPAYDGKSTMDVENHLKNYDSLDNGPVMARFTDGEEFLNKMSSVYISDMDLPSNLADKIGAPLLKTIEENIIPEVREKCVQGLVDKGKGCDAGMDDLCLFAEGNSDQDHKKKLNQHKNVGHPSLIGSEVETLKENSVKKKTVDNIIAAEKSNMIEESVVKNFSKSHKKFIGVFNSDNGVSKYSGESQMQFEKKGKCNQNIKFNSNDGAIALAEKERRTKTQNGSVHEELGVIGKNKDLHESEEAQREQIMKEKNHRNEELTETKNNNAVKGKHQGLLKCERVSEDRKLERDDLSKLALSDGCKTAVVKTVEKCSSNCNENTTLRNNWGGLPKETDVDVRKKNNDNHVKNNVLVKDYQTETIKTSRDRESKEVNPMSQNTKLNVPSAVDGNISAPHEEGNTQKGCAYQNPQVNGETLTLSQNPEILRKEILHPNVKVYSEVSENYNSFHEKKGDIEINGNGSISHEKKEDTCALRKNKMEMNVSENFLIENFSHGAQSKNLDESKVNDDDEMQDTSETGQSSLCSQKQNDGETSVNKSLLEEKSKDSHLQLESELTEANNNKNKDSTTCQSLHTENFPQKQAEVFKSLNECNVTNQNIHTEKNPQEQDTNAISTPEERFHNNTEATYSKVSVTNQEDQNVTKTTTKVNNKEGLIFDNLNRCTIQDTFLKRVKKEVLRSQVLKKCNSKWYVSKDALRFACNYAIITHNVSIKNFIWDC